MESIYNLIPKENPPEIKRPIPYTRRPKDVRLVNSTFGCSGSSRLVGAGHISQKEGSLYGPPKKEHGLTRTVPTKTSTTRERFTYKDSRKPPVPTKMEQPILGVTTKKNFITSNAVDAILMAPKRRTAPEPNYLLKEDFGRVPAYLEHVKEEIRRENELVSRYVRHAMGVPDEVTEEFEELSNSEREELIDSLKMKWDAIHSQYQKMAHHTRLEGEGPVRRKDTLEKQLNMLERDIEHLSRANQILIKSDC